MQNNIKIELYDTTLRDGTQQSGVNLSLEEKLLITEKLDELGVDFIEGGFAGSNPKDDEYFKRVKKLNLKNSKIISFGQTRKPNIKIEEDIFINALLSADTDYVALVGKASAYQAEKIVKTSLEENINMISDSVKFLHSKNKKVFFDAEHFFDGYRARPDYALTTLKTAREAGAECLVLCDTNGGMMPWQVKEVLDHVSQEIEGPLGIHTHNDSEMAVANALTAVEMGVSQVQGTINGFGERCGNTNLCSILPNLKLKMKIGCISMAQLKRLRDVSRYVSEISNLPHNKHQAYVGESAFAHKGGIHVHAVRKNPETYEHVPPEKVGNRQRILISDYAGRSSLLEKAKAYKLSLSADDPKVIEILSNLKELEHQGFQFEGAEGSFELMMKKALGLHRRFFRLIGFRVTVEKRDDNKPAVSEATVRVEVNGQIEHTAAIGHGPVNALDHALRRALEKFYPVLSNVKLLDYKVRVLTAYEGTGSRVRVLIESGDGVKKWGTVGVSENIIEASWQALVDSIEYKLLVENHL